MARISGVEPKAAGWIARIIFFFTRRKIGKVPVPMRIAAHRRGLLRATAVMEMVQVGKGCMPPLFKTLASLKVASLVGCPF